MSSWRSSSEYIAFLTSHFCVAEVISYTTLVHQVLNGGSQTKSWDQLKISVQDRWLKIHKRFLGALYDYLDPYCDHLYFYTMEGLNTIGSKLNAAMVFL